MKWIILFIAIQIVSFVLALVGVPICAALAWTRVQPEAVSEPKHWPRWAWLWDNEVDGIYGPGNPPQTRWQAFYWSALRNPCNNLRFVPGVSKVGRPLWRRSYGAKPGGWYVQAGWNSSGYPVLSAGRNVNPF